MNFGQAIEALQQSKRVARQGWNGKSMYLFLVKDYTHTLYDAPDGKYNFNPEIVMKTADNKLVHWLASQTDMLSEDWEIVE